MDWSRLARAYAWQLPLERAALAAAIKLADPTADDALLDVGTGTGALLRELAKHPRRPRIAIGIDECRAMLERARALPAGWSVQAADARRLPFADGTFSIVTAIYLLHVVDGTARRQIVSEARRVLRPGGRLVVVTPTRPRTSLVGRGYPSICIRATRPAAPPRLTIAAA
jgi:ubiquinone/menaquinone biosynthesis C-methylase UbiE